jgi:hypothetical protein
MHWFWRAALVTIFTATVATYCFIVPYHDGLLFQLQKSLSPFMGEIPSLGVAIFALPILTSIAVYEVLWPHRHTSDESRCRKCNYILRGITEPRCPECGERI